MPVSYEIFPFWPNIRTTHVTPESEITCYIRIYLNSLKCYSTYNPIAAPPKCAAWSKNLHPNKTPAKSIPIMNLMALKNEETYIY